MKRIVCSILLVFSLLCLISCKEEENYDGQVMVTFHLEGGTYMNCTRPVVLYFDFQTGGDNYICSPTDLTRKEITKSGYDLAGWYRTKIENGDEVSYADPFDFENDKVDENGITLYALWEKKVKYAYNVCYYNSNNELIVLGTYNVKAGDKFEDYLNYAANNWGNTALGYYDESGNEWDTEFKHPGGETSLTVNVYVKYLEGEYLIAKSADDLGSLIAASKNIYLVNDIDLNGNNLCFKNYRGHLIGNGYTISNFNLNYGAGRDDLIPDFEDEGKTSLCLSLFGKTKGAIIENVSFKDVTFKLNTTFKLTHKVYIAPLAVSMEDTKIKNVNFDGTLEIIKLPTDFNIEENLIISELPYYLKDDLSIIENVNVNLTKITN